MQKHRDETRRTSSKKTPLINSGREYGLVPISQIEPSRENELLYRPVVATDPEIRALADSIRANGVLEPLVISADYFVISGHRRLMAARIAELQVVPCYIDSIRRDVDPGKFVTLLREHNRQRDKTNEEKLHEEIASIDPEEAWAELELQRLVRMHSRLPSNVMEISGFSKRSEISAAKLPLLNAVNQIIENRRPFWPLDVRQLHYALLNNPPLRHAKKLDSVYANDERSYKSLCDLLTRARLEGLTQWSAIGDETRPVFLANTHDAPRSYMREQLDEFLGTYRRNLLQSQPNYVELLGEKNTLSSILLPIADEYTIPLTIGRGYCSLAPRHEMAMRWASSGKPLVLLIISDLDPDGQEIAQSFARSLRDDFGISAIFPIQIAITQQQVEEFDLPPNLLEAKQTSSRYGKFVDQHGTDVYEVEALQPEDLQQIVRDAIEGVLDMDTFNAEREAETQDGAFLSSVRQVAVNAVGEMPNKPSGTSKGGAK